MKGHSKKVTSIAINPDAQQVSAAVPCVYLSLLWQMHYTGLYITVADALLQDCTSLWQMLYYRIVHFSSS